ncbi:DUF1571 domain-containing protein [Singulisphaera acidiphila]|uniref:DUF1571 domain-containing protein n=1 Tax=Singulisphaera acidiphila (strain ATCC BAA-1392 / DSM 18658 / VKM B-2454 / MOB10) TaxID=886293 RepID=L0DNC4_SINAD|nr:DUF1571 domain-containing protein [Singulisphaera acidiphila]AGA30757.1 Protein of unknown function (DUF1571) [Singulisphaera acidiphila DSM 18658]
MAGSPIVISPSVRSNRWRWSLILLIPVAGLAGASWWLTAPLEDIETLPPPVSHTRPMTDSTGPAPTATIVHNGPPAWPDQPLEGEPAKTLLLETLLDVGKRLDRIEGYTATFRKTERLRGILGAEQTLAMKVRQRPFAVYFKFLNPQAGKEVVYAEGHHENKVIAHSTGVSRWLVPRLAVPPDHPLAMAETRHSITEAGLSNLNDKLIAFRRLDLKDDKAITILDRITDSDGRPWLRSVHRHLNKDGSRPFYHVEVLYDVESRIPLKISNYDWPEPGREDQLALAERYCYDDLKLDAPLSSLDFDPANPAYAFHRY